MGSYDAIVSLLEDLQQHLNPNSHISRSSGPFPKREIEILHAALTSMDSLLRDSSGLSYNHDFIDRISEDRIVSLARKAGTYLDFWTVRYLRGRRRRSWVETIGGSPILDEITQEMVSINQELNKIHQSSSTGSADKSSTLLNPVRTNVNTEGKLIGLESEFIEMLDSLTGQPLHLKVFPIMGMAGIGKTTFSKKLYNDPLVVYHFYIRAWVTVSQQYQVRKNLLALLHCLANDDLDDIHGSEDEELREKVYRILKNKRYLIVLDDMWDTEAWDDLKRIFPDDKNGSRIILTTRLQNVAVHASEDTPPLCLRCLSIHESWELLSLKVFINESCPREMMEIGMELAFKCHGLPLTIVVLGGLLLKMNKNVDAWEKVARSVGSLVMEGAEQCQQILSLSYNHLPDSLKLCFLYMGVFPVNYEISVKYLTWLWVAEGFIRSDSTKSLEDVAEDYMADLTSRSLVLVKRRSANGMVKTCYIHDLMRELCLKLSKKHDFLHEINNSGQLPLLDKDWPNHDGFTEFGPINVPRHYLQNPRRLSFHSSINEYSSKVLLPYTRSLMSFEKLSISSNRGFLVLSLELLNVLNIIDIVLIDFPTQILMLTQLKFLALTVRSPLNINILSSFSLLQTLIINSEWNGYLTSTFWDMLELRHFHVKRSCQSYLSTHSGLSVQEALPLSVLNNLTSLSTIRPISCIEEIFRSMPCLKRLGVYESEEDSQFRGWFGRLVILLKLEKLKYAFSNPFVSSVLKPDRLPPWQSLPPKLVKLTLSGTSLPWEDMSKLSMLPKLEVLKLRNYAFSGKLWKSRMSGFCCLKFLLIGSTNLEIWESDGTHFPNLRHLVLRHCRFLEEIPCSIGEAPLLETIELHHCKNSAVISARKLKEEQESLGNDGLTIHITEV